MRRLNRVLATTVSVCVAGSLGASAARAQPIGAAPMQSVRVFRGTISGTVSDDQGGPLAGALVSALGATMAMTVSDARGYFAFEALPAGEYILQAHLSGFRASSREFVRVGALPSNYRLQLRRLDVAVATSGTVAPVTARPILAVGFALPAATLSDQSDDDTASPDAENDDHPHNETAWRLRHIKRSVLKDAAAMVALSDDDDAPAAGSLFTRAMGSAASLATIFTELPFSGEVNLLTTGAFIPGALLSNTTLPRGVAYLSIGAPTPAGDWSVRAAMSGGDLSSWLLAGAFKSRPDAVHAYSLGLSYSTQEYLGGNPSALAAVTDGSRNVGEVYAFDRWSILPRFIVEYGGRYARYDYLEQRGLLSPRLGITFEPWKDTRIVTTVAQRMIAPGAEEFLATDAPGPWLPPERTFAPLGKPGTTTPFRVEQARYMDVTLEHEFEDAYVLGVRRFDQDVNDQLVTLFGLDVPGGLRSAGHYYVGSAGTLEASGWALRLSSPSSAKRVRGSIDYSVTRAHWLGRGDMADIARQAPAAIRSATEDLHDVTTSFETDIPETATRVFVLYKINTAYTRGNPDLTHPGLDARFDVQVNQALPFALHGTRWEVLLGVRNLFRDPIERGSVYDELLVVRPPTRIVGGVLVRF